MASKTVNKRTSFPSKEKENKFGRGLFSFFIKLEY